MTGSEKFAFIAGCNAYAGSETFPALKAAINDVMDMRAKCKHHGFDVYSCTDVSWDGFQEGLAHAKRSIGNGTRLIIFHWSGHATSNDRDVLHPVKGGPIDLAQALQSLSENASNKATTLVFLDCCRGKDQRPGAAEEPGGGACGGQGPPFSPEVREVGWAPPSRRRSAAGRPGVLCEHREHIYIQACAPGLPAREETSGEHVRGYLTKAILENMFEEGTLAENLHKVKEQVLRETNGMQDPWLSENCRSLFAHTLGNPLLYGSCCFNMAKTASEYLERDQRKLKQQVRDEYELKREECEQKHREEKEKLREEYEQKREECEQAHREERERLQQELEVCEIRSLAASRPRTPPRKTSSSSMVSSPCTRHPSLVDGSLSTLLERRRKPWIVLDGLIGVGKSELLKQFQLNIESNMHVVPEPIDQWAAQLDRFYEDPSNNAEAFTTNMMILAHHLRTARLTAANDSKHGVISERSPVSQVKIFAECAYKEEHLTQKQLEIMEDLLLQQQEQVPPCMPTHYVILEANADTCLGRIRTRGRRYEQHDGMPGFLGKLDDLLRKTYAEIHRKYEKNLSGGAEVIRISATGSPEEVCEEFKSQMSHLWSRVKESHQW